MLQRTLLVCANPWHSVDHYGRPAGHCPKERLPTTVGHQGYVGCVAIAGPIVHRSGRTGDFDHDTVWHFSAEPVKVPDSVYYRRAIQNGEVFAADEKTTREIFGPARKHVPVVDQVQCERLAAERKWEAAHDELLPEADPFAKPTPIGSEAAPVAAPAAAEEV